MTHLGEERTNEIRYRFNPLMRINFSGTKISSVTDSLLVREILRGRGKVFFTGPHPLSGTVHPLPKNEGYFLDDGFCDFTFGSAQNDSIAGGVQVS